MAGRKKAIVLDLEKAFEELGDWISELFDETEDGRINELIGVLGQAQSTVDDAIKQMQDVEEEK